MIDANKLKKAEECKGRLKELVGDEGLEQLAKDCLIPHYVIINPITGEETIWFVPSEVNDWFNANYVRYNQGGFTPKFEFIYFDRDELRANAATIPLELSKISDLYELPVSYINTPPGVYFLCKEGIIKYIGQAMSITNRIVEHVKEGLKDFDKVFFIQCPLNRLNALENALIRYYKPAYNRASRDATQKDLLIVNSILSGATPGIPALLYPEEVHHLSEHSEEMMNSHDARSAS